ncbi:BMP family lipoprotein [Maridesulfovibrio frigidus]|uniref:BMP family lipoprotein n=1 Tax=Maridesulfovibrio frigidus TaxID=340956 RepID=UPI0004E0BCEA|nr:BMP family ABC transporter substrate-binding protein [Maridesulfovibrio frigidus]
MKSLITSIFTFLILSTTALTSFAAPVVVGFLTGSAGLGDLSFNDMAYGGIRKAQQEFGFKLIIIEPHETGVSTTKEVAELASKSDIIILLGGQHQKLAEEAATNFPDKKFIMIEVPIDNFPNVSSAVFNQYEGSFMAGALAGYVTKTNKIGFVGGADTTLLHQFEQGYKAGAEYAAPGIEIFSQYTSPVGDFSGFENPKKGFKIAMDQYSKGADIVFTVAGLTGNGVIEAARRTDKYAIGVDSDQDSLAKGNVLTSMIKRLDVAAYEELKKAMQGHFKAGPTYYGLKNNGVSLSEMKYTKDKIPTKTLEKIKIIKQMIISGELKLKNFSDN